MKETNHWFIVNRVKLGRVVNPRSKVALITRRTVPFFGGQLVKKVKKSVKNTIKTDHNRVIRVLTSVFWPMPIRAEYSVEYGDMGSFDAPFEHLIVIDGGPV